MIIDSSALICILRGEADKGTYIKALETIQPKSISAANFFETAIIIDAQKDQFLSESLDILLTESDISIEPVTEAQSRLARMAYRFYGKGSGHPAQLNFGDCFAYALAREKREPLLFKGQDFSLTDVENAVDL